jgi:transposase
MPAPVKSALDLTPELLELTDIEVMNVRSNASGREIIIEVRSTKENVPCRECGKPTNSHGLSRKLTLRHLPILGKKTTVEIKPRRGICNDCSGSPTTTEQCSWYKINSKMTKPYEQHLLFELVNSTVADVSAKEAIDYHAIADLINRYIETEVDFSGITALGALGLDEISLKKGYQDFVTLVTYRTEETVNILGVIKGREKASVKAFLSTIPLRLHKTIRVVCCDLYEGYLNACKEVFKNKVPVVADRFHVRKLYRRSLVVLRKAELKRLKRKLSTAELKPAIALLQKHKDYFTEEEKPVVEKLFSLSPKLKTAYQFSRELSGIFDSYITPAEAKEKIATWINEASRSSLKCFNKFIQTLLKYQTQIIHYFKDRDTSGFVEGFNNKVKVLKRRCYGLANPIRLFQRLIIDTKGRERFAPGVVDF